jgi:hypothetical protein
VSDNRIEHGCMCSRVGLGIDEQVGSAHTGTLCCYLQKGGTS